MNENENIDEIRRDIEDTRQRISTEIEALEGKLTPAHAKEVVTENVKERIVETRDRLVESVGESASMVRDSASRIGTDIVSTMRANPIPLAMIGVGAGWLVWEIVRPRREVEIEVEPLFELEGETTLEAVGVPSGTFVEDTTDREIGLDEIGDDVSLGGAASERIPGELAGKADEVKMRASQAFDRARSRASSAMTDARMRARDLASNTRERANVFGHDARDRASMLADRGRAQLGHAGEVTTDAYNANPIAFGALALVAGLGLAMALPRTRSEDRMLGRVHGRVLDRAKHYADNVKTVAKDVVQETASTAKNVAKSAVDEGRLTR